MSPLTTKRSWTMWLPMTLVAIAFALWTCRLDAAGLWRDEGFTLGRAEQPISSILANRNLIQGVYSPDLHPPLYFLFQHGWLELAGRSEFSLRFPSVLAMVLGLAVLTALGTRVWGRSSGTCAAALAVLSPFLLWYAQEARMYAWIVLGSALLLYTWWPLMSKSTGWRDYLKFALAAGFLTYTHYSGVFLVGFAVLAIALVRIEKASWVHLAIIVIGVGLASIPLYDNVRELLTAGGFEAFARRSPWTLFQQAVSTFSLGAADVPDGAGWRLAPMALLSAVGALAVGSGPRSRRLRAALIGFGALFGTLFLFYAASWLQPNYSNPRHLTLLSPIWFLLGGHGLAVLGRRVWPAGALVGATILVLNGEALYDTMVNPQVVRDDVRGLAAYIEERALPGDAVLWHNAVMLPVYRYYSGDLPFTAIPRYGEHDTAAVLGELERWSPLHDRIWFVSYPPAVFFASTAVPDWMHAQMVRLDMVNFQASWTTMWLELYRPVHVVEKVPADYMPAHLNQWQYRVRGLAWDRNVQVGRGTWFRVYWSMDSEASATPPSACLRLVDSVGTEWTQGCVALDLPDKLAASDALLEQQLWLPLPVGLAPTSYAIELNLGDAVQSAGTLQLQRPIVPPTQPATARFANDVEFVDLEWIAEDFRQGLWAIGDVLWRADSRPSEELTATVRLEDWLGRDLAEQSVPLGPPDYPIENWHPGEIVRSRIAIDLPYTASGKYRAKIALSGDDGILISTRGILPERWVDAGRVLISEWPLQRELPAHVTNRPSDIILGAEIRLVGYEISRTDDLLTVELYWKSDGNVGGNVGVFVHVGRRGEEPLAQHSGVPVNWTRPVESWRPGEIVDDSHSIPLPSDVASQELAILIGMYDLDHPDTRMSVSVAGEPVPDNVLDLGPLPIAQGGRE